MESGALERWAARSSENNRHKGITALEDIASIIETKSSVPSLKYVAAELQLRSLKSRSSVVPSTAAPVVATATRRALINGVIPALVVTAKIAR